MKYLRLGIGLLLLFAIMAPTIFAQNTDTIADVVIASAETDEAEFTILLELIQAADLTDTLADEDVELTVFAPTDAAFEALVDEFHTTVDDLLKLPELIQNILLYHVADGILTAEDVAASENIMTLQGSEISVSVDEDGNVILDDVAMIVTADIEAANGVIHVIDAVLLPSDDGSVGADVCIVSTSESGVVRVRVGPGENRTSVSFLPDNVEFTPLGQSEDDSGNIWFQLDKETAAPGRSINEAWVAASDLDMSGDCSTVGESAPPPIIPIVNQPPPPPASSSGDSASGDTSTDTGGDTGSSAAADSSTTLPANGTYTIVFASESHVSCEGGPSIPFPSAELFSRLSFTVSVQSSAEAIFISGDRTSYQGPGYFTGQFTYFDGSIATIQVFTGTNRSFSGRLNFSETIDGVGCSVGTNFSASR